jgi:hypothetical protein
MPTTDTSGGLDINTLINAALAIYGIQRGNKAPKFYPAPLTPGEEWKTGATKDLFNYASQYTNQYLQGLGNMNPDFRLSTTALGNPAFMGGIHLPDFSKMKPLGAAGATASTPTTTTGGSSAGSDSPFGGSGGAGGDPFGPQNSAPAGGDATSGGDGLAGVAQWMREHPQITMYGADAVAFAIGAIGGPLAGIIASIGDKAFKSWFNSQNIQTLPDVKGLPPGMTPGDLAPAPDPNAPQDLPNNPNQFGSWHVQPGDLTPAEPSQINIDPATGMWSGSGNQTYYDWVNQFNSGLMYGGSGGAGGDPSTGDGSWSFAPKR